jgi:hypothetical protein
MAPRVAQHPAFARAKAMDARVPPPRVKELQPNDFVREYRDRKKIALPVKVGIRTASADESETAMSHARAEVNRADITIEDERVELYNDAIRRHVLAVALVKAEDVTKPFFDAVPNDAIRVAFTPTTLSVLWDEYATLCVAESPTFEQVDEQEALECAELLAGGVDTLSARARRLAHALLTELRTPTN